MGADPVESECLKVLQNSGTGIPLPDDNCAATVGADSCFCIATSRASASQASPLALSDCPACCDQTQFTSCDTHLPLP